MLLHRWPKHVSGEIIVNIVVYPGLENMLFAKLGKGIHRWWYEVIIRIGSTIYDSRLVLFMCALHVICDR